MSVQWGSPVWSKLLSPICEEGTKLAGPGFFDPLGELVSGRIQESKRRFCREAEAIFCSLAAEARLGDTVTLIRGGAIRLEPYNKFPRPVPNQLNRSAASR